MKKVTEQEYKDFKEKHDVSDSTCMSKSQSWPCGSYDKVFYFGVNKKIKMCGYYFSSTFDKEVNYYIW